MKRSSRMPRGGHKRMRPRRRRSHSSAANSSSCRHRTRSSSGLRVVSPSFSWQQQPPAGGQEQENTPQASAGRPMREEIAGRSERGFSLQTSATTSLLQPLPVVARQHANATATSTLSSAASADSTSSRCSPARTASSSERFSSPISPSGEAAPARALAPSVAVAGAAPPPGPAAISTAPAVAAAFPARTTVPWTLAAARQVAVSRKGEAVQTLVSGDAAPGASTGAPRQSTGGVKVAAALPELIDAAAAEAHATAQGHTIAAERAAQTPIEGRKERMEPATYLPASSPTFLPSVPGEYSLQIHSRANPQLSCSTAEWEAGAAKLASTVYVAAHSAAAAGAPPSATAFLGLGGAAAAAAARGSVTGGTASAGDTSAAAEIGTSASGAVAGPLSRAAARVAAAAAEDAVAACGRSTETPLLKIVEAGGAALPRPQQRAAAAAASEEQQRQLVSRSVAASAASGPCSSAASAMVKAESSLSRRLVCNSGVVPAAADNSNTEETQDIPASSPWFQSLCPSTTSVSFPSRSPTAVDAVAADARDTPGPSAAASSNAMSPAGRASGATTSAAGASSPATDASAATACLSGAFAPLPFSGRCVRHSEQHVKVSDAGVPLLLQDIADTAAHPVLLALQQQQAPAQRSRRLPVLKIADGSCQRLLLQTPELLKLVHCHNPRGILEDAADGALKLRDLRQVVGRRTMQRPSVEVRRNCVLVNLPFVRAILLHGCVVLLPPADFSSAGYSPFAQLKKKRQQQSAQQARQQVFWEDRQQQQCSWEHPREQGRTRPPWHWPHAVSDPRLEWRQQQGAWAQQKQPGRREQLLDLGEEQLETEERKQRGRQQPQGALTSPTGGDGREAAQASLEENGTRSSGNYVTLCKSIWHFFCGGRHGSGREGRGGAGLLNSSDSSNGYSDYTFLWGGEAAPVNGHSCLNGHRGLLPCDVRERCRPHNPFYRAQRKVHPAAGPEEERSNSEPAAVSPTSALEDWLDGGEGSVNLEQQHRLILKLVRITAFAKLGGTAAPTPNSAVTTPAPLSGPAECAALEAILEHVCDGLTAELEPIADAAANVLRVIHEQPSSTRKLRKVGDLRRRLDSIKGEARGADDALRSLLDSEDHLRRLEVSRFWGGEDVSAEWLRPSRSANSADIEVLLESYEQELDALLKGIVRTEEALDDALQLMELHLASIRNAFLKSEIALDVVGVLFGGIAAFAGVFGMNIKSGWEDKQNTFWILAGGLCFLSCVTCCLVYMWFRRQKL